MKKIMIIMVMAILCHAISFAQHISEDKVPATAVAGFKNKFPAATAAQWEIEKTNVYEVSFANGKQKQSALFTSAGKWEKTEVAMEASHLPEPVAAAFIKSYPDYKIIEAEKIETPSSREMYELEITKGLQKVEIQLLPDGKIVHKENISGKN